MKKENTENLIKRGSIRIRDKDNERVKSIISSAEKNADFTKTIAITEKSSDLIFREIYESIRQLGDAKLWLLGYEPRTHEVSLDILKDLDIKDKLKLNSLDRFKKIRHDLNYRGFSTTLEQAKEIIEFWNKCGKEIIKILKKDLE